MSGAAVELVRQGLWLVLLVAAPPVGGALLAGVVAAVVQAALRVEERTLSVVPRLLAAGAALGVAAPFIGEQLVRFTAAVLAAIPSVART